MLNSKELETIKSIKVDDVVPILQELIRARSDFPPGDTRAAISVVERRLKEAGIEAQRFAKDPLRMSLVAEIGKKDGGPVLLFHSHIDTVPAGENENWAVPPFDGSLKEGMVYGRGAGDDKGSVAAQLAGFIALSKLKSIQDYRIRLAIVADEESGGTFGTRWLHDVKGLSADYLVIGEQTGNQISVAERVACGITLTVHGKSAHGATPWNGVNAVLKTCRAIIYLQKHIAPIFERRSHPFLPPPTINIGKIEGGVQWNIVPEKCVVLLDRRLIPGESREQAMGEIRQILDQFSREVEPLDYILESKGKVAANVNTDPQEPFVQLAYESLVDLVKEERPITGYVQTSDGRWFASDGIPIIHFGPGDPSLAHAPDEYVSVDQVLECAQFLAVLGLRWQNYLQKF